MKKLSIYKLLVIVQAKSFDNPRDIMELDDSILAKMQFITFVFFTLFATFMLFELITIYHKIETTSGVLSLLSISTPIAYFMCYLLKGMRIEMLFRALIANGYTIAVDGYGEVRNKSMKEITKKLTRELEYGDRIIKSKYFKSADYNEKLEERRVKTFYSKLQIRAAK